MDSFKVGKISDRAYLEDSFDYLGARCLVMANDMGFRCGYIGVKNNHPVWGKNDENLSILVYGGITFSGHWLDNRDYWFIGFDCGHGGIDKKDIKIIKNYFPEKLEIYIKIHGEEPDNIMGGTIKSREFVRDECIIIAQNIMFFN